MQRTSLAIALGLLAIEPDPALARALPSPNAPPVGLCRRLPVALPLPPERAASPSRWEPRAVPSPMADGAVPPPPPPPAPAPMAGDVVVTGSRVTGPMPVAPSAPPAPPAPRVSTRSGPVPPSVDRPGDSTAPGVPTAPRSARPDRQPQAGLLTAGEHDDLLNPQLYRRYVEDFLRTETLPGVPRVDTARVLTVAVTDPAGRPVPFVPVTLTCGDGQRLTLPTLADGTAVFFPDLDRLGRRVSVTAGGYRRAVRTVTLTGAPGAQRQTLTLDRAAPATRRFDLALMIDTTGSMSDELNYLKAELGAILTRIGRRHPDLDIRIALIAYRDVGDEYVTRTFSFTGDLASIEGDLSRQSADGGGDYPEAVEQAMARAVALDWRPDAVKSLLFVADAPPHGDDVAAAWASAEVARARRIQIVPVAASGVGPGAEYLMRAMAAVTQSRYLFLTDDSGIGDPHAPPAIDCYLVTRLDRLIERVLDAQIAGHRIEPAAGDVLRTVGTYDAGRCLLPPTGTDADAGRGQ